VLPEKFQAPHRNFAVFAPTVQSHAAFAGRLDKLHDSIEARRVVELDYRREDGQVSVRPVRPLCLAYWGTIWTLGAWCEMRNDFRNFSLDRIDSFQTLDRTFIETPEISLAAFLRGVGSDPQYAISSHPQTRLRRSITS
jgi:predicted DNA-binding transcriptional regulator YafY